MSRLNSAVCAVGAGAFALLLAGCHHKPAQTSRNQAPERPDWSTGYPPKHSSSSTTHSASVPPHAQPAPRPQVTDDQLRGKPTLVETGMASWYGSQYGNRKAADGSQFDPGAMTAAHRTLPLGTMARVTNEATGESVVVKITDRGPFSGSRVLDLSEGAAKAIGVYRAGVAKVKIEAYVAPAASSTGIWCVQTGAFATVGDANDLKAALLNRYKTAKVQQFQGPTGYWVRIDPAGRDKQQAAAIQEWIGKPDEHAASFLVRLD